MSFSIVRHPFERLASAYQNKFVDCNNSICKKYAKNLEVHYGENSFGKFVQMILDQSEKNCQQLNNCKLDNHWKPFISRCAYCDVRYSVIAKAETIEEDQKYIGHMANVTFQQTGNIGLCKLEMN